MPDSLIFADPGTGNTLVRHSDPFNLRTEWVVVGKDPDEVILRWLGTPLRDARLEPAFRIEGPRAVMDWRAVETVLEKLAGQWSRVHVRQRWLEECRAWAPDREVDGELWSFTISKAMLPWLSKLDPWLALKTVTLPLELLPFFQAVSWKNGLRALGIDAPQPRLVALVENDIKAFLASGLKEERVWDNLLAASRFRAWLDVQDLAAFWDLPLEEPMDVLTSLDRHNPSLFAKLRDRFSESPVSHPWTAGLRFPLRWVNVYQILTEYSSFGDFQWPSPLRRMFEVSKEEWTTRFLRAPDIALEWWGIGVEVKKEGVTVGFIHWDRRGRVIHSTGVSEKTRSWLLPEVAKLVRD